MPKGCAAAAAHVRLIAAWPFRSCPSKDEELTMNNHAKRMRAIAGLLVTVGLGCAVPQVKTETTADPRANFSGYRTFQVQPGKLVEHGVVNHRNEAVRVRIDSALAQELVAKGLAEAVQAPDLIVTYESRVETRPDVREVWWTPVYGWFVQPKGEGLLAGYHHANTLTIDVLDGRTRKLLWRSVARGEDKDFSDAKYIDNAVEYALASYPGA
jgi:hypothetical protein